MKKGDFPLGSNFSLQTSSFTSPLLPLPTTYFINVDINPDKHVIEGTEKISLANCHSIPLKKIAIQKGLAEGNIFNLRVNNQMVHMTPSPEEADTDTPVLVELPTPVGRNESVEIQVDFKASLTALQDRILMLRDWHPRLWWGYSTCEDFKVKIDVPSGYEVIASGVRRDENNLWQGDKIRNFGIVLAREFERAALRSGDTLINAIFDSESRSCVELLLETAGDAIDFYRSRLHFYPQPFLSIVPGGNHPSGGFPFATGIISIHGQKRFHERPEDFWRWITAHEIAHQYWGEYVLEADSPGWLWIALGIYLDRDYARERGLNPKYHHNFIKQYLEAVQKGIDTTVEKSPEQLIGIDFDYNNIVVHGKGFAIINALESIIGRDAFQSVYKRCLSKFGCMRLNNYKFQMLCEEETEQDLTWFFNQWVRSNRYLAYKIVSVDKAQIYDRHIAKIRVERVGTLEMPISVEAYFEDHSVQNRKTDRVLKTSELTFASEAPLKEVKLDPDGMLALLHEPLNIESELIQKISEMRYTGEGAKALHLFAQAQQCKLSIGPLWGKLGLALYDNLHYSEALQSFRKAAELSGSDWKIIGWVWQGHILDILGRREEAVTCYRQTQKLDLTESIQHSQYNIEIDRQWIEKRLDEPFSRSL